MNAEKFPMSKTSKFQTKTAPGRAGSGAERERDGRGRAKSCLCVPHRYLVARFLAVNAYMFKMLCKNIYLELRSVGAPLHFAPEASPSIPSP